MTNHMKKVAGKVARKCVHLLSVSSMLLRCGKLPEVAEAQATLENLSADPKGSCWTDGGFQFLERSVSLSVIIPAYNVEKYIVQCINSVLHQKVTFAFEVIVVNDGSTDQTAMLLEQYVHDPRVRIIHQQNQGLSGARNTGIDCSKGEYLCFLDSDDALTDGALEVLMEAAVSNHAKLVVGSYERCLRDGTVCYTKRLQTEKATGVSLPGFAHGRVIHYSIFQNLRFPMGYWYEDSIMAQIVHPMCRDDLYTVSKICYQYFINEAGIVSRSMGNVKSLDSLWITMGLLVERERFGLMANQTSFDHFLFMVRLTYLRTVDLGPEVVRSIFVLQRMLLDRYYRDYQVVSDRKKQQICNALRANDFRKYILACE